MKAENADSGQATAPVQSTDQVLLTGSDEDVVAAYDGLVRKEQTLEAVANSLGVSRWTLWRRAKRARERLAQQEAGGGE